MAQKEPQIAEIISEDSEAEEVDFWESDVVKNLQKEGRGNRASIDILNKNLGEGYPGGLKNVLESKVEYDPGHSHMFLPRGLTVIQSFFESKDGWATGGVGTEVITPQIGGVSIATGAIANDDAWMLATTTGFNSFDVSQLSVFQSVLKVKITTSSTAYWGVGDITAGGGFGGANEAGYGFKCISTTITNAADNGSGLIRITATAHGFSTNFKATVSSVGGTTEANGTWTVTVIDANTFDLVGSTFTNAYTSGGKAVVLSALTVKAGTEVLTTIPGIAETNFNEYKAVYDGIRSVSFFVNGKLKAKHTTSIPNTDDDIFATFYIKTRTAVASTLYAKYLYFVQENV